VINDEMKQINFFLKKNFMYINLDWNLALTNYTYQ